MSKPKKQKVTGMASVSSGKDERRARLAERRQIDVAVFCAKRRIFKQDFARLANISLSTLYRYLRGESVYFSFRIEPLLTASDD